MSQPKSTHTPASQLSPVEVKVSSGRETPETSFASILEKGLITGAEAASAVAPTAGYAMVPGAAVLGAAVTSAGIVKGAAGQGHGVNGGGMTGMGAYNTHFDGQGASNYTPLYAGGTGGSGFVGPVAQRAQQGDAQAQTMMATQQMQEMNQAFNLQYLQLQERMQHEGRAFTAMSNVMKSKSDTARNTLSNLK